MIKNMRQLAQQVKRKLNGERNLQCYQRYEQR